MSAQHALLRWSGEHWVLKDLGSRNGTLLDGRRISAGEECVARVGARIAFGKPEQEWLLVDDSPACTMVVPLDGGRPTLVNGEMIALPSDDDPQVTIYPGNDGGWVLEHPEHAITSIRNMQSFDLGGRRFRFCSPESSYRTSIASHDPTFEMAFVALTFAVSRDEEYVQLSVHAGQKSFELGARSHHYVLLELARRRLADAAEGLPETSCGWVYVEDLARDPSMAPPQLNIDVFRIRKQFSALGIGDGAGIIERRPRTRQLRIGTGRISIVGL